jgi:acyl-CoA synthetase (AMP-forming)/AMP-acid ligase II
MPAPDFDGQSLPGLLRELAARHAHQRAFTFMDYPDLGSTGRSRTLTWAQLHDRARAVAGQLRATARPGDRAVLLVPQGLDYVAGFLGCLMAGVIAVPLFPPDQPGHENRVAAVIEDCEPACALVTEAGAAAARKYLEASGTHRVPLVQIDAAHAAHVGHASAAGASADADVELDWEDPAPDDIAYLQYTSGSTRTPAGVMITHRNAVVNARQGLAALGALSETTTTVSWLPLFHDMGLVMSVVSPLVGGFPSVLMDPVAFLARPERWLRLLGAYPNVLSAAPNFAYDYCATKVRPEAVEDLRLDEVRALINGAEPVRPRTVHAFAAAFAANGLRPEVICPSYGLAEATVFVASDGPDAPPREVVCERAALAEGRIVTAEPAGQENDRPTGFAAHDHSGTAAAERNGTATVGHSGTEATGRSGTAAPGHDSSFATLIACGRPVGQEVRIVDPASPHAELSEGAVGEILVRGPNVGLGYWKRAEQSAEVFGAHLPGTGEQPWLRTGDLGALHSGLLLVTGRLKDLLIIDGRNHYPQDVEETVHAALDADRRERAAVFAVPGEAGESVVAVAERRRDRMKRDVHLGVGASSASASGHGGSVDHVVRAQVAGTHGLRLDRLVLVPPGTIPRTSSGKVSRSACRAAYLRGEYAEGHR